MLKSTCLTIPLLYTDFSQLIFQQRGLCPQASLKLAFVYYNTFTLIRCLEHASHDSLFQQVLYSSNGKSSPTTSKIVVYTIYICTFNTFVKQILNHCLLCCVYVCTLVGFSAYLTHNQQIWCLMEN